MIAFYVTTNTKPTFLSVNVIKLLVDRNTPHLTGWVSFQLTVEAFLFILKLCVNFIYRMEYIS